MKKKKKIFILLLILLIVAGGMAFYYYETTYTYEDYYTAYSSKDGVIKMPKNYTNPAKKKGTLQVVEYNTTLQSKLVTKPSIKMQRTIERRDMKISTKKHTTKKVMVYLPYNYNPNKRYNIMYLMHGRGGSYRSWLGTEKKPSDFKNVLDHMIQNKDIPPIIVVTPGLAYEYGGDDSIMEGTCYEIIHHVMPTVESKYSTVAKTADKKGFTASRKGRIFAGFSMGGSLTWHMLKDHLNYFSCFIPMSMAYYYDNHGYSEKKSIKSSEEILKSIKKSGYTADDYWVYAATGDDDFKWEAAEMQVWDLIDDDSFYFSGDNFMDGNIIFKTWPGRWHRYTQSYPYIYNALIHFYDD